MRFRRAFISFGRFLDQYGRRRRLEDKAKALSENAVMKTGTGRPGSIFCGFGLKAFQDSLIFRPRWPSAGPTGGDGLALPAGICSLMKPLIFFAILKDIDLILRWTFRMDTHGRF